MAEVSELYKKVLDEEDWYPFNPVDNSLPANLANKAKTLFFKGDVEFLEKIKTGKIPKGIDPEAEKQRGARSSVIPMDHEIQIGVGALLKYPHVFDPMFLVTLTKEGGFQGLAINPNRLKRHIKEWEGFKGKYGDIAIIAKINDASRMIDPKYVAPRFANIQDAKDIGANFTGWSFFFNPNPEIYKVNMEEMRIFIEESREQDLLPIVWAYPNGPDVTEHPYLGRESATMVLNAAEHALNAGAFAIKVFYPEPSPEISKDILNGKAKPVKTEGGDRPLSKPEIQMLKGFANTGLTNEQHLSILCKRISTNAPVYVAGGAADKGEISELVRMTKIAGATGNFVGRKIFCHNSPEKYYNVCLEYWQAMDDFYPERERISDHIKDDRKGFIDRVSKAMHFKA
jgi:DhnA family fructose-bisphosphate aldolase class Ia